MADHIFTKYTTCKQSIKPSQMSFTTDTHTIRRIVKKQIKNEFPKISLTFSDTDGLYTIRLDTAIRRDILCVIGMDEKS
jgi:hypothetical protein